MDSDYPSGIFWSLCYLSFFVLWILITPLVYFGHCVVCPLFYGFWLPLWYILVIVLSVLCFMDSDYPSGIFWSLCCLSFFFLWILITPLVSFGHCVVCPSLFYGFWLPLWYILVIVLSVLCFMDSDYPSGIFWLLCCLSFFVLWILITPLVYFGHCVVCPSLFYGFWLPLWYLLIIVLSVLLCFMDSDYPSGIVWSLCCLSFFVLWILITPLIYFGHCVVCPSLFYGFWLPLWYILVIVLSVLCFMDSDYPSDIFWSLCYLSFFVLWILITPLIYFGHCVVCPSLFYGFWLPLWYILVIVLSVLLCFMDSDYPSGIFWSLCCLSVFVLWILITPLIYFDHCVVCPSLFYGFWLPLWYLLVIVLSVLCFMDSDYPFGIFWSLCCLSFFVLWILITPLIYFGHCVVCPSLFYGFWLPLWYLLVIVLSVLLCFMDSDSGIFKLILQHLL